MNETILNLPWQIQVVLAGGYAGYLLAYVGIRDGHRTVDTVFVALVFGVVASATLAVFETYPHLLAGTLAFIAPCVAAVVWRRFGRGVLHKLLRRWDVSWADDTPSAWAKFQENSDDRMSQIAVELDDYTWLECEELADFENAPFGPVYLGTRGDIALYVTRVKKKGEDARSQDTVRNPDFGDRITYVPASRIRRVTMRFKKTR
ncbi:MAG: hypothetical protein ACLQUZ_01290 [Rhizomicrobium sp.]